MQQENNETFWVVNKSQRDIFFQRLAGIFAHKNNNKMMIIHMERTYLNKKYTADYMYFQL